MAKDKKYYEHEMLVAGTLLFIENTDKEKLAEFLISLQESVDQLGKNNKSFVLAYQKLQSTITAQELIIKRLKEAGENIRQEAVTQEPFSSDKTYSYLEIWDDLINELGEK